MSEWLLRLKKNHIVPKNGFIGVFISVVAVFLVVPLFMKTGYAHIILQICFTSLILSTIYAIHNYRFVLYTGIALGIPFLVFDSLSVYYDSLSWMLVAYSFYCAYLLFALFILLKKILGAPFIDTNVIFGAITVYLLAGILWAKFYFLVDIVHPGSFHGIHSLTDPLLKLSDAYENQFDFLYFSFTTMTTLGEGDIAPLHHLAKSLTILEAVFGQLFTATVIAKMVSIWTR